MTGLLGSIPTAILVAVGAVALAVLVVAGTVIAAYVGRDDDEPETVDENPRMDVVETHDDGVTDSGAEPKIVDLARPRFKKSPLGLFGEAWQLRQHIKDRRKLAQKGYVEWYLIDSTFPGPRFVKPVDRGTGVPELEHNDGRYLFPPAARLPNERQGTWTYVHKRGDARPVNLKEPGANAMSPEMVEEYSRATVQTEAPSWLSKLDLDPMTMATYGMVGLVGFAILWGTVMGGS